MAKSTAAFRCSECGWQAAKWVGRCGECQAWGTVEETSVPRLVRAGHQGGRLRRRRAARGWAAGPCRPRRCRSARSTRPTPRPGRPALTSSTGCSAAAWSPARCCCSPASPGVGKSTLLLEAGALVAASGPVLYITGEESAAQVRLRADRIGAVHENLYLAAETDLDAIITHVTAVAAEAADHRLGADHRGRRRRRRARRRDPGPRGGVGADRRGQGAGRCRPSWSGTSPRTARWRARAPWSTSSTWCCTSRATGTRGCGWSARSRTGTARPTRSAASTSASTA